MNKRTPGVALLSLLWLSAGLSAQQTTGSWPCFGGPNHNNISPETGWKIDGGDKLWTQQVGIGYSNVSIGGGRLYTMGHDKEKEQDTIYCLDALSGKELWVHRFPAKTMAMAHAGGVLSTPTIDGALLFASNREGNFFCFDAATGKVRWSKNLHKDHSAPIPTWGLSASPLVLPEQIVMNVGPLLSFDRKGKLLWKTKSRGHCYATPMPFTHNARQYLAVFTGDGLSVHDRKSGKEVAHSAWKTRYDVNAATPVVIENKIFISSGYNTGCSMLEFDGRQLKTLWTNQAMRNHMTGCVYHDGHLFGFDETMLKCLSLDGKERWRQRGLGKCALTLADGKLIVLARRGELIVAKASSQSYQEMSRVEVLKGGQLWTTPVLCGGLVYCRSSHGELTCVDRRSAGAAKEPKTGPTATKDETPNQKDAPKRTGPASRPFPQRP